MRGHVGTTKSIPLTSPLPTAIDVAWVSSATTPPAEYQPARVSRVGPAPTAFDDDCD